MSRMSPEVQWLVRGRTLGAGGWRGTRDSRERGTRKWTRRMAGDGARTGSGTGDVMPRALPPRMRTPAMTMFLSCLTLTPTPTTTCTMDTALALERTVSSSPFSSLLACVWCPPGRTFRGKPVGGPGGGVRGVCQGALVPGCAAAWGQCWVRVLFLTAPMAGMAARLEEGAGRVAMVERDGARDTRELVTSATVTVRPAVRLPSHPNPPGRGLGDVGSTCTIDV